MDRKHIFITSLLFFVGMIIAFLSGYYLQPLLDNDKGELSILKEAYNLILEHGYYDPPEGKEMEYGMIQGMLNAYGDPFSTFNQPVQHELTNDLLKGEYGGIGVDLERNHDGSVSLFPYPNSSAAIAGILENDILLQVDDLIFGPEIVLDEINAILRGVITEKVKLRIHRPMTNETMVFDVDREIISIPSVTYHASRSYPFYGILKINILSETTPEEIEKAINALIHLEIEHLILDLRSNYGGLLQSGIDSASLFSGEGIIIYQQYKDMPIDSIETEKTGKFKDLPISILVNKTTASAAEIFAGILQYQGRAKIYGSNTFGKDSIQLIFELDDKSSLHVTTARWWIPSTPEGFSEHGLIPDVSLDIDDMSLDSIIEVINNQ